MQAWANCPNGQGFWEELLRGSLFPSPGVCGRTQEAPQSRASCHFGLLLLQSVGLRFFKMGRTRVQGKKPCSGCEVFAFDRGPFIGELGVSLGNLEGAE